MSLDVDFLVANVVQPIQKFVYSIIIKSEVEIEEITQQHVLEAIPQLLHKRLCEYAKENVIEESKSITASSNFLINFNSIDCESTKFTYYGAIGFSILCEYLTAEVIEAGGNVAKASSSTVITENHFQEGIISDNELLAMAQNDYMRETMKSVH